MEYQNINFALNRKEEIFDLVYTTNNTIYSQIVNILILIYVVGWNLWRQVGMWRERENPTGSIYWGGF